MRELCEKTDEQLTDEVTINEPPKVLSRNPILILNRLNQNASAFTEF
jgi:hypothetical protein